MRERQKKSREEGKIYYTDTFLDKVFNKGFIIAWRKENWAKKLLLKIDFFQHISFNMCI